jgi:hypothetical protein
MMLSRRNIMWTWVKSSFLWDGHRNIKLTFFIYICYNITFCWETCVVQQLLCTTVHIIFTKVLTFALAHGKNIPIEKTPNREPAVMPVRLFPACGNKDLILCFYTSVYSSHGLLCCGTVWSCRWTSMFHRYMLLLSSGKKRHEDGGHCVVM